MTGFAGILLSYLLLYKYSLIFGLFFVSAVILPLPDNTVLLAAGAFASQGYFGFWYSFLAATLGTFGGDLFDYLLSRRFGHEATRKLHIKIPPWIETLERYVRKHPRLTIFATRFVGTFDSLVNLAAGYAGVPAAVFIFFALLGDATSNFLVIMLGYLAGDYWTDVSAIVSGIGWVLLAIVALFALLVATGNSHRMRHGVGRFLPERLKRFLRQFTK